MDRIILGLLLLVSTAIHAQVEDDKNPISRRYVRVPNEQAHIFYGAPLSPYLANKDIKVFVWNIKKTEMVKWKPEFESFSKNQDLILIQEAYGNKLFTETTSSMQGYRWDMGISFFVKAGMISSGTMIGSLAQPSYVVVKQTVDLEPAVNTPKCTTFAKYPIEGHDKELLVITVHGINITLFDTFARHMAQAEEEIAKHDGPVLFAGDFNTRTKDRTAYLMEMTKRLGFEEVVFKNGHQRMRFKFTSNYLDHSFVRGLKVKNAEVIGTSVGSDHKPMFLEMSVQE